MSSVNGITLHVLGTTGGVTYNPPVVNVPAPTADRRPTRPHSRTRSTARRPAACWCCRAGTYNENVLVWKPLKIQGLGPGGIIGAHELQARDPEDPRFNIIGSGHRRPLLPAERRRPSTPRWPRTRRTPASTRRHPVLRGADVTVVAQTTTAYDLTTVRETAPASVGARIDGLAS